MNSIVRHVGGGRFVPARLLTQDETAALFAVSRQAVANAEDRALRKILRSLAKHPGGSPLVRYSLRNYDPCQAVKYRREESRAARELLRSSYSTSRGVELRSSRPTEGLRMPTSSGGSSMREQSSARRSSSSDLAGRSIHPETLEAIIARGGDGMKELTAADGIPVAISRSLSSAEAMVALGWARELHSIAKERFP